MHMVIGGAHRNLRSENKGRGKKDAQRATDTPQRLRRARLPRREKRSEGLWRWRAHASHWAAPPARRRRGNQRKAGMGTAGALATWLPMPQGTLRDQPSTWGDAPYPAGTPRARRAARPHQPTAQQREPATAGAARASLEGPHMSRSGRIPGSIHSATQEGQDQQRGDHCATFGAARGEV